MKSTKLPSGATVFAQELNGLRADARGGSFLLPHQQLGALALPTNPTNGQTISLVYNGTTVTLTGKTGTISNPGDFAIQGTPAATMAVIAAAMKNPTTSTSTFIGFTGSQAANAVLVQYCGYSLPTGGTTLTIFSLNTSAASPLTSFSASTTVTGGSWTAQTMQLYVEDGTYYIGTTRVLFLGGSTPTFTAPVSNPRIDLVTADSTGTIAVVTGTEASSPTAPSYPANKVVLCEIYHVVGETAIYDNDNQQTGQGYISNDVRPIVNKGGYISSASQIASGVVIFDPGSEVQGSFLYYNGTSWTLLVPGTSGQVLTTQGASANPIWQLNAPASLVSDFSQPGLTHNADGTWQALKSYSSLTALTTGQIVLVKACVAFNSTGTFSACNARIQIGGQVVAELDTTSPTVAQYFNFDFLTCAVTPASSQITYGTAMDTNGHYSAIQSSTAGNVSSTWTLEIDVKAQNTGSTSVGWTLIGLKAYVFNS